MQLRIFPTQHISDLQKDFNAAFPYLRLEILDFKNCQTPDNDNILKQSATPNSNPLYIGNYQGIITDGILEIEETMKVNELVRLFKEEFSLCVQVFRRSGIMWLQTSMTAEWTLKKQNEHGKDLSPSQKVY